MSIINKFKKKDHDKTLYNSQRWRDASKRFLTANPLCVSCKRMGVITTSTETDHITPHKGNITLFWDRSNWQPLCKICHSTKTAGETRALTKYPTIFNKPQCSVTVVCTPLCWDYTTYIKGMQHKHPVCVLIANQPNANVIKHNEFIKQLNELHNYPPHTHAYVVIDETLTKVREHYAQQLNANVVVIQIESNDPYAIKFYKRFVLGNNEEIVYA